MMGAKDPGQEPKPRGTTVVLEGRGEVYRPRLDSSRLFSEWLNPEDLEKVINLTLKIQSLHNEKVA